MPCFKMPLRGLHFCTHKNRSEHKSAFPTLLRKPQSPLPRSPRALLGTWTSHCSLQPLCYGSVVLSTTWIATSELPHSQLGQSYCGEDHSSAEDPPALPRLISQNQGDLKTFFVLTEFKPDTSPFLSPGFFPTFVSYMALSQRWYLTFSCLNFIFPALDQFSHLLLPPPSVPDCCSWCLQHVHAVGPQSASVGTAGDGKEQLVDGLLSDNQRS